MTERDIRTPFFLIDEERLLKNLEILSDVSRRSGAKILLAQKAFSAYSCYPLISRCLAGTTASGLYEARLGHTRFGGETHVFSAAYRADEFDELLRYADHIVFNSPAQLRAYGEKAKAAGKSVGLRINPECSTQGGREIYDPCAPASRLGTTLANFDESLLHIIDGFHFHTLCEQDSDALEQTAAKFEEGFGRYLYGKKWLNMGGGHHITREGYDIERLIRTVRHFSDKYGVQVYLEPGEAVVLNAGYLVSSVLDIVHNGMDIAILDTSAACHMPDVLEMPYRPRVVGGSEVGAGGHVYRLGGGTCLAGDIIGDYSFDAPLSTGDRLVFEDMALYTMVKTNTFNGIPLPSIVIRHVGGDCETVREFGYDDFESRL